MRSLARATPLLLMLAVASPPAARERAEPLRSFEEAPAVVVGEIRSVEARPYAAYLATLSVVQVLRGERASPAPSVEIAWEEPAPSLPPRWSTGDRVLVALAPLPTASIWRERVPEPERRNALVGVAGAGAGHVDRPSPGTILELEHYLALDHEARARAPGVTRLSKLAARSEPNLALACLSRLEQLAPPTWSNPALAALIETLLREDDTAVVAAALDLISTRRPAGLGEALGAEIAARSPEAPAALHAAQARLDGGLDMATSVALLESPSPERRSVAARFANGEALAKLRLAATRDSSESVRAAAVTRMLELDPEGSLRDALRSYDDSAPSVRLAAARAVAALGPPAEGPLLEIIASGGAESVRTAIATLSLMEAGDTLLEISETHDDPAVRALAKIAIGRPIGHQH